mmetsp:Transcript_13327/g.55974  ORF Transcript_13327/g.55974 Transcript_13327/m.55974 type:complete len:243 (+) Transcript_13327:635-1363(+)
MTFEAAPPARNTVVEITTESSGSTRRLTMVCSAVTTAAPQTTTSMFLCGTAAWPPAPATAISYEPLPAMMVPARVPTVPLGVSGYGQLCSANAVSNGGSTEPKPASSIRRAPAPPSSAGWNARYTVPFSKDSRRFRSFAAPKSMATWPSWPQACMMPLFRLFSASGKNDASLSSSTGSASMSALSKTAGDPPVPMTPTTPGEATSLCSMPIESSSRFTSAEVPNSSHISSGARCSSRRIATT